MIIISRDKESKIENAWFCNKWVSFKFFNDTLIFLTVNSKLHTKISFLNEVRLDTLDLKDFQDSLHEFKEVLNEVILYNQEKQGKDMYDPSFFQVYYDKLLELKKMFYEVYNFSD